MKLMLEVDKPLIFDTHFIQRGRFVRQSEAVAKYHILLGIGALSNQLRVK